MRRIFSKKEDIMDFIIIPLCIIIGILVIALLTSCSLCQGSECEDIDNGGVAWQDSMARHSDSLRAAMIERQKILDSLTQIILDSLENETLFGVHEIVTCSIPDSISVGSQVWSSPLDCVSGRSSCYLNDQFNCDVYGRLYDWNTAMQICPKGWHLPDTTDFNILLESLGGRMQASRIAMQVGWSKTFAGMYGGRFTSKDRQSMYWTSTRVKSLPIGPPENLIYTENFFCGLDFENGCWGDHVSRPSNSIEAGFSVRCIKD